MENQVLQRIRDVSQFVTEEDIQEVANYMESLRKPGITPSRVREKGLDFVEVYVPSVIKENQLIQMKVGAYLLNEACSRIGIHAEQMRKEKLDKSK